MYFFVTFRNLSLTSHFCFSAQPRLLRSATLGPPLTASVAPPHQIAYASHEARQAAAPSMAASWEIGVRPRTTDPPPHPPSPMMQHHSHSHAVVGPPTFLPNSPPSSHAGKHSTSLNNTTTWHFNDTSAFVLFLLLLFLKHDIFQTISEIAGNFYLGICTLLNEFSEQWSRWWSY